MSSSSMYEMMDMILPKYIAVLLASSAALLLWRLWKFTIRSWLFPFEPRRVPYWIPVLGHSFTFFTSSDAVLEHGLKTFGYRREPFSVRVLSEQIYCVTSPEDVAEVYRNTATLSWGNHLERMLQGFGVRTRALRKGKMSTSRQDLMRRTEDLFKQQLLPGKHLKDLQEKAESYVQRLLTYQSLREHGLTREPSSGKYLPLEPLCRNVVTEAMTKSMFGGLLYHLESNMSEHLRTFAEFAWIAVRGLPQILTPSRMTEARRALVLALEAYIRAPEEDRSDACWVVQTCLRSKEFADIDMQSKASIMFLSLWASTENTIGAVYWILVHILYDDNLRAIVQDEIGPAFSNDDRDLDGTYLVGSCPILESIYHEILRMTDQAVTIRQILSPTRVGNCILQAGNSVLISYRLLHENKDVWGDLQFDGMRFAKDPKLKNHSSYRPFGGGASLCAGRYFTKSIVLYIVAIILHRLKVDVVRDQDGTRPAFPRLEDSRPPTGIPGCAKGTDIDIEVFSDKAVF